MHRKGACPVLRGGGGGNSVSLPDYEPGVHVVLSGTGNPDHLQANINSLCRPPLPEGVVQKLRHIFRNASDVTGQ